MKSIFGFLTGVVIGAGGLIGLRKALSTLDKDAAPAAPTGPVPTISPTVETSPVKTEQIPSISINEDATPVAAKEDDTASLVGEPEARHTEPVAATETDPVAITPRSETSEPAVPDEPEVETAADISQASNKSKNGSSANGSRKSGKNNRAKTDDFTVIADIGPAFNQKLHDAGIKSFKDLANQTPAEIADKTGIPLMRIESGRWIEQAQELVVAEE